MEAVGVVERARFVIIQRGQCRWIGIAGDQDELDRVGVEHRIPVLVDRIQRAHAAQHRDDGQNSTEEYSADDGQLSQSAALHPVDSRVGRTTTRGQTSRQHLAESEADGGEQAARDQEHERVPPQAHRCRRWPSQRGHSESQQGCASRSAPRGQSADATDDEARNQQDHDLDHEQAKAGQAEHAHVLLPGWRSIPV